MSTAILLGATGEIGGHLLQELVANPNYSRVYILGRLSINRLPNYQKVEKLIIDFDNPNVNESILEQADIFCAIGTRVSQENFEKVDYGYVYNFAKICEGKVRSFNLVSAMGANSKSRYKYLQIKGRLEDDLLKLNLGAHRFYRPSMLIAPERENLRWSEAMWIKIFQVISPIFIGKLGKWKGISPKQVAYAMVTNALNKKKQIIYLYNDMIIKRK